MRLDARLHALYPTASRRALKRWLESRRVRVNDRIVSRGDAEVAATDRIVLSAPAPVFPPELRLVHEDTAVIVVDKPPGLLTIATERERERTVYRLLAGYLDGRPGRPGRRPGGPRLFIVHRLDRETSGLLVFAKSAEAKRRLQAQFEARAVQRVYVAVVEGRVRESSGTLRSRLHEGRSLRVRPTGRRDVGREAITHYRVIDARPETTLLELRLDTGRRAQIRAQLADLGHPIVGDRAYGSRRDPLRRLCLHATRLGFVHPGGRSLTFDSPMPPAFARV